MGIGFPHNTNSSASHLGSRLLHSRLVTELLLDVFTVGCVPFSIEDIVELRVGGGVRC